MPERARSCYFDRYVTFYLFDVTFYLFVGVYVGVYVFVELVKL